MPEVADLYMVLRAETAPFTRGMARAAESGESFTAKMGGVSGLVTKLGKATAVAGLGVAAASVKMASDFQAQTNVLMTAAGELPSAMSKVRAGILQISSSTGTSWRQVTEGMYDAEKAGFNYAKGGLNVVKAAAQGAREENAPLADVVGAVTTVMKNYHLPATMAVQVTNALKTAAGESKATFGEYAKSLHTVLPLASSLKVPFSDIAGLLATMTQRGESAQHSSQLLYGTLRSFSSPSSTMVSALNQIGLTTVQLNKDLSTKGLSGVLDEVVTRIQSKMGPAGTYAAGVFKESAQATQSLRSMLGGMSGGLKTASQAFLDGRMSAGEYTKDIKGLGANGYAMGSQFKSLVDKSKGFSDGVKSGNGPLTTFNDLLKKATGGSTGLQTALLTTGKNAGNTQEAIGKVSRSLHDNSTAVEGWKSTSGQLSVQMAKLKASLEAVLITVGSKLIPVIQAVIGFFARHKTVTEALAGAVGLVLTGAFVKFTTNALTPLVKGIGGLGKTLKSGAKGLSQLKQGFTDAEAAGAEGAGTMARLGGKLRTAASGAASLAQNLGAATKTAASSAWSGLVSAANAVGGALKTAGLAALDFSKKALTATLAAARQAATFVIEKTAALASAIAEKAMAAAQWMLDAAMDANPVMLVVIALAALVAGLIYAYNHCTTFRDIVNAAFHDVATVALWLWHNVFDPAWHGIADLVEAAWSFIAAYIKTAVDTVKSVIQVGMDIIHGNWSKAWADVKTAFGQVWNDLKGLASTGIGLIKSAILNALGGASGWLVQAGRNVIDGLVSGIKSKVGSVTGAIGGVAKEIRAHLPFSPAKKGPLSGAGSPDLAGRKIAQMLAEGLGRGIAASSGAVTAAMRGMARNVIDPFAQALGIASPSKKFKTFGGWIVYGLVQGLTGGTASVKAATKRVATDLYADFHGHTGLRDYVNRENTELLKLAKQRDSVATRLKAATKNLKDLQADWTKEKTSVAQGIMQGMSAIAPDNADGRTLSSADVLANMRQQFQQASQFAAQLKQLQKEGLSSSLIQQYAQAGVAQAGATVSALASGPQSAVSQMNSYQKSLQSSANSVGTSVATSMYGAGINSAKGLVKGLKSQEAAIEKEMLKIAKSMQGAIKKALGIKSPSTVMAELGDYTAQGMALGINRSGKQAAVAAKGMAMLVRQSAALGPGMAGASVGGATGVSGSGNTYITINVAGSTVTENQLVDSIETAMLRKGMRRPVTYTNYKR